MNTSLPLSNVMPVSVFISPAASPGLTFNQALIVGASAVIPSVGDNSRLRQYTSVSAMLQDGFLTTSPEYIAATMYFGQTPSPTYLWVGRQDLTAISAVAVGNSGGTGYALNDIVTIVQTGALGGQAQVSAVTSGIVSTMTFGNGIIASATIGNSAGTGYALGDVITVTQSGGSNGRLTVTSVVSGQVTGVAIISGASQGTGYHTANNLATTGGHGTGLTVNITAGGSAGTSYTSASNLSTTGGTGTGLTVTITAVGGSITAAGPGSNAGTGYIVGDIVTVVQAGSSGGTLQITAVTNGVVTEVSLVTGAQGSFYTAASSLVTSGGSGTGLTITITTSGETPVQAIAACRAANTEWYPCMFAGTASDAEHIAIAGFIQAAKPASVYFLTSGDAAILNGSAGNLFATLQGLRYNRTFMLYSTTQNGQYPNNIYASASVMGYAMGANSGAPGSYTDLMFKLISGIGPEPLTQTQVTLISGSVQRSSVGFNGNVFVSYNNGAYSWVQNATMADGSFFDQTLQLDMLSNDILLSGINLLTSVPALPITNGGVTQMRNVIASACTRSQVRGFIAPSGFWNGVTVGPISAGAALPQGFYVYAPPVSSLSAGARSARQLPPITVLLQEAQSGHSLTVSVYVQS